MRITIKVNNFSLDETLKSEQCPADFWFFDKKIKAWVTYVQLNEKYHKIVASQKGDKIQFKISASDIEREKIREVIQYILGLDFSLEDFLYKFSHDRYLMKIFKEGGGLRVMRDINKEYRILAAILTQNTSVKMIKTMQRRLILKFGQKIKVDGEEIHSLFTARAISDSNENELKKCKLGYRASYLLKLARALSRGSLSIKEVERLETEEARKYLMNFKGIGKKVADIILMYGFGRGDVFPIDRWVKNAIEREYLSQEEKEDEKIYEFAKRYFGKYAAFINLLIFNYERKKKTPYFNICIWR
jgi:N-glycosylase/DNA lyase